jgi:hypothetical protein
MSILQKMLSTGWSEQPQGLEVVPWAFEQMVRAACISTLWRNSPSVFALVTIGDDHMAAVKVAASIALDIQRICPCCKDLLNLTSWGWEHPTRLSTLLH